MDAYNTALQYCLDGYDVAESISIEGCSSAMSCKLENLTVGTGGRILEFNICLKRVCPGKRTALAIELNELDEEENEHPRGIRALTLPAHNEACAQDIWVRNIRFVLPEDDPADEGPCKNGVRRFVVRKTTHYVDRNDACPVKCRQA